ncbi:MAG: Maf family protein [Armatimonadaceae bacterium]
MNIPPELLPATDEPPRLYLASASPRRRELLGLLGVRFTVVVSRFNEASLSHLTDPAEYVVRAAEGKAADVASRRPGVVLGVDTDVVAPDGSILGKPADPDDARRMLRLLSGKTHQVFTGVAVLQSQTASTVVRRHTEVVRTAVTFADLPDAAIDAYVATKDPLDKAGAYGLQGRAMAFITRIEGDHTSVIGLPLWRVAETLTNFGVLLWDK